MIPWLRRVIVPRWWALGVLLPYSVTAVVNYLQWRNMGSQAYLFQRSMHARPDCLDYCFRGDAAKVILVLTAVVYAVYRITVFHPIFRPAYSKWLASTPWRAGRPLPVGPVHLVPQDAFLGALALALTATLSGSGAVLVLECFLIPYVSLLALALAFTEEWAAAYCIAVGLGGLVLAAPRDEFILGVAALCYVAGWIGLWRSLRRFPWSFDLASQVVRQLNELNTGRRIPDPDPSNERSKERYGTGLGWQYDLLSPKLQERPVSCIQGCMLSALAAWWVYVCAFKIWNAAVTNNYLTVEEHHANVNTGLTVILVAGASIMAMVRILIYRFPERFQPISLWGRFRTGRWVIPGFDRIFVAPVLIIATAVGAPRTLLDWGYNGPVAHAIGFGLAVAVALMVGPTATQWALTGKYRMLPGVFGSRPQNMV
jgi:hypothetical protein